MNAYNYSHLEPGHIRLASFSLTAEDELHAVIKHVHFDEKDPITYSALSYVWGDPSSTVTMICDGATLQITTTLNEALRRIIKSNPNEYVWVDQICINQEDDRERSEQVKMMTSIFNLAKTVLVWLGPSTPSTPLAIDLITRVGAIATEMAGDIFLSDSEEFNRESLETHEEISNEKSEQLGIPFSDTASWDAFSEFYDKPWYRRIWIVQEILPARNAIMICGANSVPWALAKNAATWYHFKAGKFSKRHKRAIDGMALTMGMNLTWNFRMGSEYFPDLLGQKTGPTYLWAIKRLLMTFRNRLATDPRDKVYALLGLSHFGLDKPLEVDYSKDVKMVFTETARAIIRTDNGFSEGNLDILLSARRSTCTRSGPQEDDWPSWVPDWRVHVGHGCQWGIGELFREWHDSRTSYIGKHVEEENSSDLLALRTKGIILGRATYVSPHRHASEILLHGNMRKARDICLDMLSSYPTGEDVAVAFALTMLGGRFLAPFTERNTSVEVYAESYLGWFDVITMPHDTAEEGELQKQKALPYMELGFNDDWIQAIISAYCERRWYVLDTGYMGLGNHHMQEGDVIARLVGLSLPCVLRPRGTGPEDGYEFIGEAYCHGAMDVGEYGQLPLNDEGLPAGDMQDLVLR